MRRCLEETTDWSFLQHVYSTDQNASFRLSCVCSLASDDVCTKAYLFIFFFQIKVDPDSGGWIGTAKQFYFSPCRSPTLDLYCTSRKTKSFLEIVKCSLGDRQKEMWEREKKKRETKNNRQPSRLDVLWGLGASGWPDHETVNLCGPPFWPAAGSDVLSLAGLGSICQQQQSQWQRTPTPGRVWPGPLHEAPLRGDHHTSNL